MRTDVKFTLPLLLILWVSLTMFTHIDDIFIALFFLVPMIFLLYSLNKEKFSNLLRLNVVFAAFYVFLWSISAF